MELVPYSFPLPGPSQRDAFFGLPRTFWVNHSVPAKARPDVPVRSFVLPPDSRRGRRYIDYASARAFIEALSATHAERLDERWQRFTPPHSAPKNGNG